MKHARPAAMIGVLSLLLVAVCVTADTDPLAVDITIQPKTLVIDSASTWVTVHTDIAFGLVDPETVMLGTVAMAWCKSDSRGNFVAKFADDEVKGIVDIGTVTLTLTGLTVDKEPFEGTDTIEVK